MLLFLPNVLLVLISLNLFTLKVIFSNFVNVSFFIDLIIKGFERFFILCLFVIFLSFFYFLSCIPFFVNAVWYLTLTLDRVLKIKVRHLPFLLGRVKTVACSHLIFWRAILVSWVLIFINSFLSTVTHLFTMTLCLVFCFCICCFVLVD